VDGYIKNKYKKPKDANAEIYLTDNHGREIKALAPQSKDTNSLTGRLLFIPHENAYFGYNINDMCGSIWWLYRDTWKVKNKDQCFGAWAQFTSKLLHPTRVGLFVEHHTSKEYKTYLVVDNKEYKLDKVSVRGASVNPDGCRVVYGSGELKGKGGRRQILKLFNACKFMEEKGKI
jgi:hypothetical protein